MFSLDHLANAGIHPLFVHFPIALLLVAVVFDFVQLFFRRPQTAQLISFWITIFGTVGAILAVVTGNFAEEKVVHSPLVEQVLEQHEEWAVITMWVAIVSSILKLVFFYFNKLVRLRIIPFLFSLVVAFFISYTGHLGGKLVFGHSVGTLNQASSNNQPSKIPHDKQKEEDIE